MSRWFARTGAALLASLPLSILSCGSPPAPIPPPPTIHLSPGDELSVWQSARAVLETRCVVCHGCYDAPCQLKLGSFEGIERGASQEQVYDASRLLPAEPTRLGIDAHGVAAWRKKGFFAVLPEGATKRAEDSPLLRMLELKRRHPLPPGRDLAHDFTLALDREQTCASAGDFDAFAEKHPLWGMPYGLPGLASDDEATLSTWVRAGAPHPGPVEIDAGSADAIRRWEAFLNGSGLKERLVARYLYEHLFLASLHFEDAPGQDAERRFFRLVRSRTPSSVEVDEIPTRRPFEAPGASPFYYRFVLRDERPLEKTHMPYPLSAARLAHWRTLFFEPSYEVTALPSYDLETAANPFRAFEAIPVRARYRFLLEEAEFTLMGFIKGPVCRGQIALDVIEDRFWVAFLSPDAPWTGDETRFLSKTKQYLDLPAEKGSDLVPLYWFAYEKEQRAYVDRRHEFLLDQTRGGKLSLRRSCGTATARTRTRRSPCFVISTARPW